MRMKLSMTKQNHRLGVCIDTCHIFAAGYDLRSEAAFHKTFEEFGRIVGFDKLEALSSFLVIGIAQVYEVTVVGEDLVFGKSKILEGLLEF